MVVLGEGKSERTEHDQFGSMKLQSEDVSYISLVALRVAANDNDSYLHNEELFYFFGSSFFSSGFGVGNLYCEARSDQLCSILGGPSTYRVRLSILSWPDLFPRSGPSLQLKRTD